MNEESGSFAAGYAAAERFWKGKAAQIWDDGDRMKRQFERRVRQAIAADLGNAAKALLAEAIEKRKVAESLRGAGAESAMKEAIALRDQAAGLARARDMVRFHEGSSV